jgi:hypothetical protein
MAFGESGDQAGDDAGLADVAGVSAYDDDGHGFSEVQRQEI